MSKTLPVRHLLSGALMALALAMPLKFAAASSDLDDAVVGKTADEITDSLVARGYEVRKVKPEDGMLEAYALKDGKLYEIYVDQGTGKVDKVKEED